MVISPFGCYANSLSGCEVVFHKREFPCICAGCLITATEGRTKKERDSDLFIKLWAAHPPGGGGAGSDV